MGGYLIPEPDKYSGVNEYSIILDQGNRIWTNEGEFFNKLKDMGLKYSIGEHDFLYDWKGIAKITDELAFVDSIQEKLKGTGVILKFTTIR